MLKTLTITEGCERYLLVRERDVSQLPDSTRAQSTTLAPRQGQRLLRRALARDRRLSRQLLAYLGLHGREPEDPRALLSKVSLGFVILRVTRTPSAPEPSIVEPPEPSMVEPPEPSEAAEPEVETDWVEIGLVNPAGDAIPSLRYELELPDGSIRRGRLNRDGIAHWRDIPSGTCRVSFPELDASSWRQI